MIEAFRDLDKERFALETIGGIYTEWQLIRGSA
ncbi:hypothetical protein J2Z19_005157 [Ensifer adhaerens]|uniref:Uncharacterized protein n=1 Tax=Ensifer adhaerens TaxID=106592 RepID=A0ACC5T2R7_ENSAD|nr:hypothetical protein [Ensifer adhaerens]